MLKGMALSISAALLTFIAIGPALADHEFIRGCDDDGLKRAVCTWPTALTRVPSPRSRAETREHGIDLTQRFLFGKPMVNRRFAGVRGLVDARRRE
jgi:hypothetical protein